MKAALDALPPGLHSHPAVCNLRNAFFVKTESSGKDLVFYCFPQNEIWNPRTAREKGIGGSEEAVIWLSRLLHRRGWNVTVYAYCGAHEEDFDGVSWKPYWMWNHRDKQDITVLWRYPQIATYEINSGTVIVDLHDTVAEEEFTRKDFGESIESSSNPGSNAPCIPVFPTRSSSSSPMASTRNCLRAPPIATRCCSSTPLRQTAASRRSSIASRRSGSRSRT